MNKGFASTWRHWRHGIRLYIAIAIILITLEGWWWASIGYGDSSLFAIRLEEFYAWLSLGLLSTAISIGPFYKVFKSAPGRSMMFDARRLFGIGAAWFATLHVVLVYHSLFNWVSPFNLPAQYQKSFLLGIVALIILLAMAFTSFDKAIRELGIWWFRLHRLVYVAVLFALLHTIMIGAHSLETGVFIILVVASATIFSLEIAAVLMKRKRPTRWQILALVPSLIFLAGTIYYGLSKLNNQPAVSGYQNESQAQ